MLAYLVREHNKTSQTRKIRKIDTKTTKKKATGVLKDVMQDHEGCKKSGVALPTDGRADPAVDNEALAGTRRSVFFRWYQALAEHSTAAVGFHFGGRPHKRNYCFV